MNRTIQQSLLLGGFLLLSPATAFADVPPRGTAPNPPSLPEPMRVVIAGLFLSVAIGVGGMVIARRRSVHAREVVLSIAAAAALVTVGLAALSWSQRQAQDAYQAQQKEIRRNGRADWHTRRPPSKTEKDTGPPKSPPATAKLDD